VDVKRSKGSRHRNTGHEGKRRRAVRNLKFGYYGPIYLTASDNNRSGDRGAVKARGRLQNIVPPFPGLRFRGRVRRGPHRSSPYRGGGEPKLKLPSLDPLFGGRADRRWNSNFVRSQLRLEEIDIAAVLTLQMDPKTSTICGAIGRVRALWHRRLDFNHARHDVSL